MQLRIFTEPQQGADYATLLRVAKATEQLGFDAFFRSDHYLKMGPVSGLPGPTDAWITLAGLALQTERIRLGTLVSPLTFRLPGPLAISVAQVDQMSGGRVELGLGTGWFDDEHSAYGIPFPPLGDRFGRLEEQLKIITGLWETAGGEKFSFDGTYYSLANSPALPKPVQRPRPPILVGGAGERQTPRLAATFADEYNIPFASIPDSTAARRRPANRWPASGRPAWPARPPRSWTSLASSRPPEPPAPTSRFSTCTILTTWNCSRPRSCPRSADTPRPGRRAGLVRPPGSEFPGSCQSADGSAV